MEANASTTTMNSFLLQGLKRFPFGTLCWVGVMCPTQLPQSSPKEANMKGVKTIKTQELMVIMTGVFFSATAPASELLQAA